MLTLSERRVVLGCPTENRSQLSTPHTVKQRASKFSFYFFLHLRGIREDRFFVLQVCFIVVDLNSTAKRCERVAAGESRVSSDRFGHHSAYYPSLEEHRRRNQHVSLLTTVSSWHCSRFTYDKENM